MGGKSNRKNKKASQNAKPTSSVEAAVVVSTTPDESLSKAPKVEENEISDPSISESKIASSEATSSQNGDESQTADVSHTANDSENADMSQNVDVLAKQANQGDPNLFPIMVKIQGVEKLELQLSPGDSVMDVRQFLLDAPDTCFFTCYDLLLYTKDGSVHHLEDHNEISEVADITSGGCSLEMVPALYDDRSIRAHVHRTRELLSLASLHTSLSTSLALQHETAKNSGDNAKVEVPELDGLGFMEDVTGSVSNLLSSSSREIKCVERIVFSSFNPPPSYRRLVGDLIYLDVVTLEDNKYCISGTTKGFYVNSSMVYVGNVFDPTLSKFNLEATTLIGLIQKLSNKFKKAFREISDKKAAAHPFENIPSVFPQTSWLGMYPVPGHERDAARAEDALTLSYGTELIGMQRDWNEELQTCREFPHTTPQERIVRDRALYKVTSDFVNAAISGAVGVISRSISPINPTDPECFHMYVHNNIFFSFAIDADLEQLKKSAIDKKLKTEEIDGVSNGRNSVIDVAPNGLAEAQLAESEQATYASANNDLKGTMAFQEADVSGLYNLAMAIVDYRGHRVLAQSVLPGILQGDKSGSLLYGSVDNGKKISWNEDFHTKVLEAAKRLHLKEHTVLDEFGNAFRLAAPVESKGIVGSDDRHYLLDLMRVTPRDANYNGNNSRFCILRPELITAYCQVKATEKSEGRSEADANISSSPSEVSNGGERVGNEEKLEANSGPQDLTTEDKTKVPEEHSSSPVGSSSEEILFNPNVFTDFKLDGSEQEVASDEEDVRKASLYLKDVVLPKFIEDLCTFEVSPMDGQTLTEALHAHGINVRYIGKVAEGTKHLPHLSDLCSNEVVVRSAKHILKDILRNTEDHNLAASISHFFNCFFGSCPSRKKELVSGKSFKRQQAKGKGGAAGSHSQSSYLAISSLSLWSDITEFSKVKYQFNLPEDARSRVKKISVIRNLCRKIGVTLAARKYDLDAPLPFETSDILDVQPIVKHSVPLCSEAKELMETGKAQLAEGMLSEAYTLFSEAFVILQQVTGPMHREVANCCRYLAMVLYHAGDMAGAIMQQHKELIINERCLGLDHPDTAHSYGNMALFYHGLNRTELALKHMSRALVLLSLSSGPDHPDVAATFINVAMMYQDIGKMQTALRYLQEALTKNEKLLGEEHIQTAICYHALAIAFNSMGAFKFSHQNEKKTYDILVKQLGHEDSRTVDSLNWMKEFKNREIQANAQKQKGEALEAASAQKTVEYFKAALQAAAAGSGGSSPSVNKPLNRPTAVEFLPRGGGVDEHAAKKKAELMKKATAKGLLLRPHGGAPVPSMTEANQILNFLNNVKNNEAGSQASNRPSSGTNGPSLSGQEQEQEREQEQGPAGLGKGASLKSKKPKSEPKTDA